MGNKYGPRIYGFLDLSFTAYAPRPQPPRVVYRENGNVQGGLDISEPDSLRYDENGDFKRKQRNVVSGTIYPNKSQKIFQANQQSSPNGSHNSHKKTKHGKLDWSVLRPPKYQNKKK